MGNEPPVHYYYNNGDLEVVTPEEARKLLDSGTEVTYGQLPPGEHQPDA